MAYIVSIMALPRLRRDAGRPAFNAVILIAAPIALSLSIWATTQTNSTHWLTLGGFALVGTALYFIARRKPDAVPS